MSETYIENRFEDIRKFAGVIERRLDDSDLNKARLMAENRYNLEQCTQRKLPYILIDEKYDL